MRRLGNAVTRLLCTRHWNGQNATYVRTATAPEANLTVYCVNRIASDVSAKQQRRGGDVARAQELVVSCTPVLERKWHT